MIRSSYDNFYVFTMSFYDSHLFLLILFSSHSIHIDKLNKKAYFEKNFFPVFFNYFMKYYLNYEILYKRKMHRLMNH